MRLATTTVTRTRLEQDVASNASLRAAGILLGPTLHPSATVAALQRPHDHRRAQAWQRAGARRPRARPLQDLRAPPVPRVEALLPEFFNEDAYYGNFHWPRKQPPTQATRLATWDAQHYLFLATEGYQAGQRSITFFPLFPWLIRPTAALPGIGPLAAALLVANALSVAAVVLLHQLVEQRHPGTAADSLLLLLAFPGALFFHFPYTESLFLFLAVAVALAVAQERWLLAAMPRSCSRSLDPTAS